MVFPFGRGRSRVEGDQWRRGPKVGVALSAGAARGWSQIGVFRELMANGFEPDIVVGTSIGAVVGGCYCAGRLDQIEAFALSLNKRRVFGLMDFTLSGMGLLAGRRLEMRLDAELGSFRVEDLAVRFATVATQVSTGHEIWLAEGPLVPAIRASYALPGLFEPVYIDGRWLMDGALVNPIPVSVCRALGAEVVVAVKLISETLGRAAPPQAGVVEPDLPAALPARGLRQNWWWSANAGQRRAAPELSGPGIASVLVDAFNITQDRIARSRLAGDPPDVTINVKCGKVALFDFHRANDLIAMGREATERAIPDLREFLGHLPRRIEGTD
jgi:NTE family protein